MKRKETWVPQISLYLFIILFLLLLSFYKTISNQKFAITGYVSWFSLRMMISEEETSIDRHSTMEPNSKFRATSMGSIIVKKE